MEVRAWPLLGMKSVLFGDDDEISPGTLLCGLEGVPFDGPVEHYILHSDYLH